MRQSDSPFANDSTLGFSLGWHLDHKCGLPRDFLVELPVEKEVKSERIENYLSSRTSRGGTIVMLRLP